ncbi:MAG: molybdopterin-binding protein, partial [Tissierellia bacterium]|nr:molybdopterin-binding protein [Tissierellia bacterium]
MRNIYLKTTDEKEAIKIFHENLKEFFERKETEIVEVSKLLGRISAKSVFSKTSSPAFHSCAMDGVMIESKITKQARENKPLYIKNSDFEFCNTGQYLKKPYDSVIMIEDIKVEEDKIVILNPVRPWENVRIQGEDVIEKDLIYTAYHEFSAVDLSVLKSCGVTEVEVLKKPIIGIIPTGDEIINSNKAQLGKILESNSQMLKAMSEEIGASAKIYDIAKDDESILKQSVLKAVDECDFIVVIAGSSAGSKDYTLKVLKDLGEVYVHGISIKPGKPAILGKIKDKPFVGLPGFPVASHIVFDNFVITTILKKLKKSRPQKQIIKGFLTKQVISSLKNTEY